MNLANDLQQAGFQRGGAARRPEPGSLRNRRLMALRNGQVQILVVTDGGARHRCAHDHPRVQLRPAA